MGADIYDWDRVHGKGSYAAMADAQDKPRGERLEQRLAGLPAWFDNLPEDAREMLAAFAEQGFEDAAAAISMCREASRMQPPSTALPDK